MKCPKCNGTNRDIAKFCMWCGEPVATGKASYNEKSILENLVDKKEIAAELAQLTAKARAAARAGQRMPMSFVITGDVGTGSQKRVCSYSEKAKELYESIFSHFRSL